jgi:hypothetical protein
VIGAPFHSNPATAGPPVVPADEPNCDAVTFAGYVGNCAGTTEIVLGSAIVASATSGAPIQARSFIGLTGHGALLGASVLGMGPSLSSPFGARLAFGAPSTANAPGAAFVVDLTYNPGTGTSAFQTPFIVLVGAIPDGSGGFVQENGDRFGFALGR